MSRTVGHEVEPEERIVVLPVCWNAETLDRLSRSVDVQALRAHRQAILAGLEADIAKLELARQATGGPNAATIVDLAVRKRLDILMEVLQGFAMAMKSLEP